MRNFTATVARADASMAELSSVYEVLYNNTASLVDDRRKNEQERLHAAEIVRHAQSLLYQRLLRERACVSSHIARPHDAARRAYEAQRVERLHAIGSNLAAMSATFVTINELLRNQMLSIESVERNVSTIATRIDASARELEDAAPRSYHKLRYTLADALVPHTFGARARLALLLFALCYCILLAAEII